MTEKNQLDSTCGISDEELTRRFEESIRIDEEIKRVKGTPVARYDAKESVLALSGRKDSICVRRNICRK